MIIMFMVNYKDNDSILTKKHSYLQSIQEGIDWKTDVYLRSSQQIAGQPVD